MVRSYSPIGFGFPSIVGGSAPASPVSGPAQRSHLLRPTNLPSRLKRPSTPQASAASLPPLLLRLLPGGANSSRAGLSPAVNQRLFTAHGEPSVKLQVLSPPDPSWGQDLSALRAPMWTKPGGGYSYSSQSPHVGSIVLRHLTGMEMQDYINERLAKPMQWGRWTYALNRGNSRLPHTPGGGDIAVHSTDALRFSYLLLHSGKWNRDQLVPAEYVKLCGRPSSYNPHSPFSLMFEVNADGHVVGAPRDAFFKSGAGGFGIAIIPSLDLVIYKMAGDDAQYDPNRTGLPITYAYDGSRDGWKAARSQFSDGPIGTDEGLRRTIEMVVAAVIK